MADQALSSLTNFALGLLVARSVSVEAIGAFALAFATYTIFLNIARSLGSQPLVVRFSGDADETWRGAVRACTAVSVATGLAGGLICGLAAIGSQGFLREAFGALAVSLVGLLLQDAWRFSFFAVGRGRSAFFNDGVWLLVMIALVGWVAISGATVFGLVLAWGGGATVAALFGLVQTGLLPEPGAVSAWWRAHRDLGVRFTAESMISVLSTQAVLYALGLLIGLGALGALRAGQLLLGPVNIVLQGIQLVAVPDAVVAAGRGRGQLTRFIGLVAVVMCGLVTTFGVVVLLLPDPAGQAVLGESWVVAKPVLPPLVAGNLGIAGTFACFIGLRALAAADRSLRATAIVASLTLLCGVTGAAVDGAVGAAWGLAAAALIGLAVWARELRAALAAMGPTVQPRTGD